MFGRVHDSVHTVLACPRSRWGAADAGQSRLFISFLMGWSPRADRTSVVRWLASIIRGRYSQLSRQPDRVTAGKAFSRARRRRRVGAFQRNTGGRLQPRFWPAMLSRDLLRKLPSPKHRLGTDITIGDSGRSSKPSVPRGQPADGQSVLLQLARLAVWPGDALIYRRHSNIRLAMPLRLWESCRVAFQIRGIKASPWDLRTREGEDEGAPPPPRA